MLEPLSGGDSLGDWDLRDIRRAECRYAGLGIELDRLFECTSFSHFCIRPRSQSLAIDVGG